MSPLATASMISLVISLFLENRGWFCFSRRSRALSRDFLYMISDSWTGRTDNGLYPVVSTELSCALTTLGDTIARKRETITIIFFICFNKALVQRNVLDHSTDLNIFSLTLEVSSLNFCYLNQDPVTRSSLRSKSSDVTHSRREALLSNRTLTTY